MAAGRSVVDLARLRAAARAVRLASMTMAAICAWGECGVRSVCCAYACVGEEGTRVRAKRVREMVG